MKRALRGMAESCILLLAALLCMATEPPETEIPPNLPDDDAPDRFEVTAPGLWPLIDLRDLDTAVSPEASFTLRGVHWRFFDGAGGPVVRLFAGPTQDPVGVEVELLSRASGRVTVTPVASLDEDTEYLLSISSCADLMPNMRCPPPTLFSTASAPRVTGLWRSGDTLIVVFSEPMDEESLVLAHGAVDLLFETGGERRSVVSDLNLADFAWQADGRIFSVAPITDKPFTLVLGPGVRALAGGAFDGTFAHRVWPGLLETCHTRIDYPDPCISPADAAEEYVTFLAPFVPEFGL